MSKYVYSTLTSSQVYRDQDGNRVTITGGANSPNKHMLTPRGVVTKVTDEQAETLEKSKLFQRHKKAGFIEVSSMRKDADKVANDLEPEDKSAPDNEKKLKSEGKDVPANKDGKKK